MEFEFSRHIFEKKSQIPSFIRILSVGAELSMRTDRRTYMTKVIVAFCNFAKKRKNKQQYSDIC